MARGRWAPGDFIPGVAIGVLSRADGTYQLLSVPAGTHTLGVQRIGYRAEIPEGVLTNQDAEDEYAKGNNRQLSPAVDFPAPAHRALTRALTPTAA